MKGMTGMDRRIVDNHYGVLGDRLAKPVKTSDYSFGRHGVFHAERGEFIIRGEKTQDI